MLQANHEGVLRSRYVLEQMGREVACIQMSGWREKAEVTIEGKQTEFYRENFLNGDYVLKFRDKVYVKAQKPSVWKYEMMIQASDQKFELKPCGLFTNSYEVFQNEVKIGEISRTSWFKKNAKIDLPDDWPIVLKVFIFLLVIVLWNRTETNGGGAG